MSRTNTIEELCARLADLTSKMRCERLCEDLKTLVADEMRLAQLKALVRDMKNMSLKESCKSNQAGWAKGTVLGLLEEQLKQACFDSTAPIDGFLNNDGKIRVTLPPVQEQEDEDEDEEYDDDFESESDSSSQTTETETEEIPEDLEFDLTPSQSYEFDPEGEKTIEELEKVYHGIAITSSCLSGVSTIFARTLWFMIDSDSFLNDVFLAYLQEVSIFSELMLKNECFEDFPFIWSIFQDFAVQQVTTFELFMETSDYTYAHELLWLLEKVTNSQKNILYKCVEETVEFKHLMGELAKSWKTMLDIQESFIMKLIGRLQASKTQQTSTLLDAIEC
jgi:hypothetical protein